MEKWWDCMGRAEHIVGVNEMMGWERTMSVEDRAEALSWELWCLVDSNIGATWDAKEAMKLLIAAERAAYARGVEDSATVADSFGTTTRGVVELSVALDPIVVRASNRIAAAIRSLIKPVGK